MSKLIVHDHTEDGIDRRGFLRRMAWAGTGVIRTITSGVLSSRAFGLSLFLGTSLYGPSIPIGVGEPKIAHRLLSFSIVLDPLPC